MNEDGVCPWDSFESATMHFCETEVCGWITQPANTWSSLAYLFMGAWLIALARRENHRSLAVIGGIEMLIGCGSILFHASSTHFGEVIDVGAMYLLSTYVLLANLGRYRARIGQPINPRTSTLAFIIIASGSVLTIALFKAKVGIWLFAIQAVLAGHLETRMARRFRDPVNYKPLLGLLVCFGLSWIFWWLDILRIVCSPDNPWLQGHAAWHLVNSGVFYFLYRFYAGLRPARSHSAQ